MARVIHVRHARQRYAMVPVLDDGGNPVKIPLTDKDGKPKTTKRGGLVTITKSVQDRSQPLPMPRCDAGARCKHDDPEIKVRTPYKHVTTKNAYGGTLHTRHEDCPNWDPWELSYSTSANVARIQSEGADLINSASLDVTDDFDSLRDEVAALAADLRDEKQGNLDNLPEGLQSGSELEEQVGALDSWVSEIESAEAPDLDTQCEDCGGRGKDECPECEGRGEDDDGDTCTNCEAGEVDCENCEGSGEVSEEDALDDTWRDEARQVLQDALDGCEI